jgi:hypothetical protein
VLGAVSTRGFTHGPEGSWRGGKSLTGRYLTSNLMVVRVPNDVFAFTDVDFRLAFAPSVEFHVHLAGADRCLP